jgi:hypothetical protein
MDEEIKELLWDTSHVNFVSLASGNYCLIVEGTMVNDFVEDHLWDEYEYYATTVTMEAPTSVPIYYNYLPADLPVALFIESLQRLDANEVERIYKLKD